MRCIDCQRSAVALCPVCQVGQCEAHLAQVDRWQRRTGALRGCSHPDRHAPVGEAASGIVSAVNIP